MSILGLIILVLDILAILKIGNARADGAKKFVWSLIILLLPVLGLILWLILDGPGAKGKA
jgi:hypothetical protein